LPEVGAGATNSRTGDEVRTLDEERKESSKGLGSASRSVRPGRVVGRGRRDWEHWSGGGDGEAHLGDIGDDEETRRVTCVTAVTTWGSEQK